MSLNLTQPLSPAKEAALAALVERRNVSRAAQVAGRCRQTVHEWLNDPRFRAELERRRQARADELAAELATMLTFRELVMPLSQGDHDRLHELARRIGVSFDILTRTALWLGIEAVERAGKLPTLRPPPADTPAR